MPTLTRTWRALAGTLLATGTVAGIGAVVTAPAAHAVFAGANGLILFTPAPGGIIGELDPSTGIVKTVTAPGMVGSVNPIGVTADGSTIAYPSGTGLATIPIAGGSSTTVSGTTGGNAYPSFTPDGKTIVFVSGPTGSLMTVPASGGGATSIFGSPTMIVGAEVSPDGRTVAYLDDAAADCGGTALCIRTIPISGGASNQVTVGGLGIIGGRPFSWSPDGTKIALTLGGAGGIAVVRATGNNQAPTLLPNSTTGDFQPAFSPDGSTIAAQATGGAAVLIAANGSPGRTTIPITGAFNVPYWAVQSSTTTTTTPGSTTTPCAGTLTGTAYKGSKVKKHGLSGVTLTASPTAGTALSATTGATGTYSSTVPCGTYTKTAAGPKKSSRICHFGSATGPTSSNVTVTSGSTDTENLFCLKA